MTNKDVFLARLAEQRDAGLKAIHVSFHTTRPMSQEEIFAALNEVEAAVPLGWHHSGWVGDEPNMVKVKHE